MNIRFMRVVEQAVLARLQANLSFTALDISNALKIECYPVRHRDVALAVREISRSGAMDCYGYTGQPIAVQTREGLRQTMLYQHRETPVQEYTRRSQTALPLVPAEQARDFPALIPTAILKSPRSAPHPRVGGRSRRRQDGALPVARHWLDQMGWKPGDLLSLSVEGNTVILAAVSGPARVLVRIWSAQRVRICRTKLLTVGLTGGEVSIDADNSSLRLRILSK